MDIRQVNELLRPFKITIECGNCTKSAFSAHTPNRKMQREQNSSKKKKKISKKSFPKLKRRKESLKHKIYNSEMKRKQISHSPFINFSKRFSAQKENEEDVKEHCVGSFFAEIKKQMEDGLKQFPDFENLGTHNEWKRAEFEPSTVSTIHRTERIPSSFRRNLFDTENVFKAEIRRKLLPDIEKSPFLRKEDTRRPFELNFEECKRFSEFFSFD